MVVGKERAKTTVSHATLNVTNENLNKHHTCTIGIPMRACPPRGGGLGLTNTAGDVGALTGASFLLCGPQSLNF